MINVIKTIQGIHTNDVKMYKLHELYIDNTMVGYVRETKKQLEIIPHCNFAVVTGKPIFIQLNEFNAVVDQFRTKGIMYYDLSKAVKA